MHDEGERPSCPSAQPESVKAGDVEAQGAVRPRRIWPKRPKPDPRRNRTRTQEQSNTARRSRCALKTPSPAEYPAKGRGLTAMTQSIILRRCARLRYAAFASFVSIAARLAPQPPPLNIETPRGSSSPTCPHTVHSRRRMPATAAEAALSRSAGSPVSIEDVRNLGSDRRRNIVLRASAVFERGRAARPIIVKATRDAAYDPSAPNVLTISGLVKEWAATTLLAKRRPGRQRGGTLLAADPPTRCVLVF